MQEIAPVDANGSSDERFLSALARCPVCARRDPAMLRRAALEIDPLELKEGFGAGLFAGALFGALASVPFGVDVGTSSGVGSMLGTVLGLAAASLQRVREEVRDADDAVHFLGRVDRVPDGALVEAPVWVRRPSHALAAVALPIGLALFGAMLSARLGGLATLVVGAALAAIVGAVLADGPRWSRVAGGAALAAAAPLYGWAHAAIVSSGVVSEPGPQLLAGTGLAAIPALAGWALARRLAGAKIP